MNGKEEGKKGRTGTGTETGTERAGRQGRNEEGNGEMGGGRERGGQRGQRRKTEICRLGMCNRMGRPTSGKVPIIFGTYNIRYGRNGGLEAALRGMS